MANKIGKREAYKMARLNAAALVECADLDALFGDEIFSEATDGQCEDRLTEAQRKVVEYLRRGVNGVSTNARD